MTVRSKAVVRALRRDVVAVLPAWCTARVLVLAGHAAAKIAVDHLHPTRPTNVHDGLLAWDGRFYQRIAESGYGSVPPEARRFFPLFPWSGKAVALPLGGREDLALLAIANVLALVALVLFRRLVRRDAGPAAAERAVWLLAVFPTGFVLVWAYAEALYLAAAIGCLLWLRERKWVLAAAAGGAAALTRPVGVLLVLAALIEARRGWGGAGGPERSRRLLAVAAPLAALGAYLGWCRWQFGDWLAAARVQQDLRGDFVDPVTRLIRAAGDLMGSERFGDGLHFPFAVLFVVCLVVVARRLPASYTAYAGAVLVISLGAENLNSLERYGLNAFPLVVGLALLTERGPFERPALTACAGGLVGLTFLALLGAYVP